MLNTLESRKPRKVLALIEKVTIIGNAGTKTVMAKIDTGATKSSVDARLASELRLGPIKKTAIIRSASGNRVSPVVEVSLEISDEKLSADFTIAERSHMTYKVLIGQNVLKKKGFMIDPLKK